MILFIKKIINGTAALLLVVRQVANHDTDRREGERRQEKRDWNQPTTQKGLCTGNANKQGATHTVSDVQAQN